MGKKPDAKSRQRSVHDSSLRGPRLEALFREELSYDLARQTAGVERRKDAGVLDEAPKAYKDIEQVLAAQADLVEVVVELKQVVCVKG